MTAAQLAVLAQAPCSRTMAGLGPPLAAARVVVWAEAIWLSGMTRAAMATARAGKMRRGLRCRAARAMFTVISVSGEMPGVRSVARQALTGKSPVPTVRQGTGKGLQRSAGPACCSGHKSVLASKVGRCRYRTEYRQGGAGWGGCGG